MKLKPRFNWDYRIGCTNRIEVTSTLFLPDRGRIKTIGVQIEFTWIQRVLRIGMSLEWEKNATNSD